MIPGLYQTFKTILLQLYARDIRLQKKFLNQPQLGRAAKIPASRTLVPSLELKTKIVFSVEGVNQRRKNEKPPAMNTAHKNEQTHRSAWRESVKTHYRQLPMPSSPNKYWLDSKKIHRASNTWPDSCAQRDHRHLISCPKSADQDGTRNTHGPAQTCY